MLQKFNLFKASLTGAIVTAVCCLLPVWPILLGAVGLAWLIGYLDYILFPLLFIFVGLTAYAWWHRRKVDRTAY